MKTMLVVTWGPSNLHCILFLVLNHKQPFTNHFEPIVKPFFIWIDKKGSTQRLPYTANGSLLTSWRRFKSKGESIFENPPHKVEDVEAIRVLAFTYS